MLLRKTKWFLPLLVSALFSSNALVGQNLAEKFTDELVTTLLDRVTGMQFEDNGRLYLWQQNGQVFVMQDDVVLTNPLLDISEEVADYGDHGLLGFTLHPDFRTNGYFYVLYGVDRFHWLHYGTPYYHSDSSIINQATFGRVTRYTADPATDFTSVIEGSRKILIGETKETGIPLMHISHGLGSLVFGEDGSLLASTGDATTFVGWYGGTHTEGPHSYAHQGLVDGILRPGEDVGSWRSQVLNSHSGKLLRFDPETGDGLATNPHFLEGEPRSPQSRVWAMGFRNPFKFMKLPNTGEHDLEAGNPGVFVVADVGSGDWEELNIVDQPGQNFGWPLMEGPGLAWGYYVRRNHNRDYPNPLGGTADCNAFFDFMNLFQYDYQEPIPYYNFCDSSQFVPQDYPVYVHSRPKLMYNNLNFNQPTRTFVPGWREDGFPTPISIETPESGLEQDPFEGIAVIGGDFYDGETYPEAFHDTYFAADFNGWIRSFRFDEDYKISDINVLCDSCGFVASLAFDPITECMYYVNFGGEVRKICYGGNAKPTAVLDADQQFGPGPLVVQFSALQSFDQNEDPLTYHWDFGDGQTSTAPDPSHVFEDGSGEGKRFDVILTVTDTAGASDQATKIITVNNTPPEIEITSFEDGRYYSVRAAEIIPLEAAVADAEHDLDDLTFEWQVLFHHNTHFHPEPIDGAQNTTAIISPTDCNETYWYRITLTVTDPLGLSAYTEKSIYPNCFPPFFEISALQGSRLEDGIQLEWDSQLEERVARYELQRAPNQINFETIGTVSPTGAGSNYLFLDSDPIWGRNNYRLKVIHEADYFEYSNIVSIGWPEQPDIWVNPNPANDQVLLQFANVTDQATFELFDISGRRILNEAWQQSGDFDTYLSVSTLPNGVYIYRANDGVVSKEGKLVIQH
ncbi:MAG: PQQ-dependent sugar dehydrogenase [Bacteroidota bacterium]